MEALFRIYCIVMTVQFVVGMASWPSPGSPSLRRFGARAVLLSPLWPVLALWGIGWAVTTLWRDAEVPMPNVLKSGAIDPEQGSVSVCEEHGRVLPPPSR